MKTLFKGRSTAKLNANELRLLNLLSRDANSLQGIYAVSFLVYNLRPTPIRRTIDHNKMRKLETKAYLLLSFLHFKTHS